MLCKKSYPYFLVTDGYYFVPVYFTKDCIKEFRSKYPSLNIVELSDKVLVLNTWSLEMQRCNSAELFTSYGNIDIRMVVSSVRLNLQDKLNPTRFPINLLRDDEFKTRMQNFKHT